MTKVCELVPYERAAGMGRSEMGFYLTNDEVGQRARVRLAGQLNGSPFATASNPQGDGRHFVFVNQELQQAAGVRVGDTVTIEWEVAAAPPELLLPADLAAALAAAGCRESFDGLAYSHRRAWLRSIESARRPQTRLQRIAACAARLAGG
ncbi:MAG: DUF1905 domain-containing protein [Fimbriimonadaceae bacterium]|nr:DUF1905 domain-containing protein [Fimbriimonadaceae bacterium]